jgi:hypothetical protein
MGKVIPAITHAGAELVRSSVKGMSDKQAVLVARKLMESGPGAWEYVEQVLRASKQPVSQQELTRLMSRATAIAAGRQAGQ